MLPRASDCLLIIILLSHRTPTIEGSVCLLTQQRQSDSRCSDGGAWV